MNILWESYVTFRKDIQLKTPVNSKAFQLRPDLAISEFSRIKIEKQIKLSISFYFKLTKIVVLYDEKLHHCCKYL